MGQCTSFSWLCTQICSWCWLLVFSGTVCPDPGEWVKTLSICLQDHSEAVFWHLHFNLSFLVNNHKAWCSSQHSWKERGAEVMGGGLWWASALICRHAHDQHHPRLTPGLWTGYKSHLMIRYDQPEVPTFGINKSFHIVRSSGVLHCLRIGISACGKLKSALWCYADKYAAGFQVNAGGGNHMYLDHF